MPCAAEQMSSAGNNIITALGKKVEDNRNEVQAPQPDRKAENRHLDVLWGERGGGV